MIAPFSLKTQGMQLYLRPIQASDKDLLQRGFSQLSTKTKFLRFSSIDDKLSEYHLKYLTEIDGIQHVAWGILDETGEEPIPAAVGRFVILEEDKRTAEVGVTVLDAYQKKGLGKILFILLNILAGQQGIQQLRYHVLSENRTVLQYLKHFEVLKRVHDGPLTLLETKVIRHHEDLPEVPEMQDFIATMQDLELAMGLE
jgi:GNAT superfamily N-acetyltransferase